MTEPINIIIMADIDGLDEYKLPENYFRYLPRIGDEISIWDDNNKDYEVTAHRVYEVSHSFNKDERGELNLMQIIIMTEPIPERTQND